MACRASMIVTSRLSRCAGHHPDSRRQFLVLRLTGRFGARNQLAERIQVLLLTRILWVSPWQAVGSGVSGLLVAASRLRV